MEMPRLPDIPDAVRERPDRFRPAPEMADWIRQTFVEEGGPLAHDRHEHLQYARLGVLWTSAEYERRGRRVLGKAETGIPPGVYGWHRARMEQQVGRWFSEWFDGADPDFVITLFAPYVADRLEAGDARAICALVEHELCHCGQKTRDGVPQFSDDGRPKWTIEGHDAELFVHEVERYGAYTDELRRLEAAFDRGPTTDDATVRGVCGCGAEMAA